MAQNVTPLPSIGEVFAGYDAEGRALRISAHPGSGRLVLSIWQDGVCMATVRLAPHDVPDVIRTLAAGLVAGTPETGPTATVRQLSPGTSPDGPAPWRRSLAISADRTRRLARAITVAVRNF